MLMFINAMKTYNCPLEPDKYYHIYNHAVGKINIFANEGNYHFFLEKYKQYISPYVDTFAYCLLPNHFHLAIRIKNEEEIKFTLSERFNLTESFKLSVRSVRSIPNLISKQFSNFFSCYAQAFNKQQSRRGGIFEQKFKRKLIDSDEYFKTVIHYIHFNPVHHGFVKDLREWNFTSFGSYFSPEVSLLKSEDGISWFHNKNEFEEFHKLKLNEKMIIDFE
jgi:REP element-mobilizing transposase RayT